MTDWSAHARMSAAQRWERASAAMGRGVTDALVEFAAPQPGERVLDVASGTGAPSLQVARRVGPRGTVVATDISAEPLKIAEQRARERGLSNISFHRIDVHELPFPADEFGLVTCRFAAMFFAGLPKALAEIWRVLRPGGRVAFACWGPFDQPYFQTTAQVVMRHMGRDIPPAAASMFKFGSPGTLASAFLQAGFGNAHDELRTVPWTWPGSIQDLWEYFQAVTVPFRPLFEGIAPEQQAGIEREVKLELEKYREGEEIKLTAQIVLSSAVK